MRRLFLLSVIAGAIGFMVAGNALAVTATPGTITVNQTIDIWDSVAGHCTLRDAITLMNTGAGTQGGCSITVASLSPLPWAINVTATGTITLGSALPAINRNVFITGPGAGSLTVDGASSYLVFSVPSGKIVSMSGLKIAHGSPLSGPGGINNVGTLTVRNCVISNNFSENAGGGIYSEGSLTMFNVTVSGNSAVAPGGGIMFNGTTMTLINVTVVSNSSLAFTGGGINIAAGSATLLDCTVSSNSAPAGSGVGGINVSSSTLTMTNSIVSGNSGLSADGGATSATVTSNGHNIIGDNSNGWFPTGNVTDQIGVDPKLDPSGLALNGAANGVMTLALVGSSPAINAGDNATCQASGASGANGKDARNKNRRTGYCDIGAYEAQPDHLNASPSSTNTAAGRLKKPVSDDFGSLTATVQDASNNNLNGVPVAWTRGGAAGPDLSPAPAGGTTPTGSGATAGQDVEAGTNNATSGDYAYQANSTPSVVSANRADFFLRNYTPASGTASGPTQDCSGQPAQLSLQVTSLSSPAPGSTSVSILWDDGSGPDVETAPGTFYRNVYPTNAGPSDVQHNYNVTFTDDNGAGAVTGNPVSINVHALPTANVGAGSSICAGQASFPLSGSGSGTVGPYGCSWSPSSGLDNASSCTPTATPSGTTTYTLTVTDSNGCSSTNNPTIVVTVNTPPATPTITRTGATTICTGSSTTLAGPTGFAGYQWYNNNVAIGAATSRTLIVTATGHYSIKVTDGNGCTATSSAMAITALANPVPVITPVGSTTVACGHTVTLNATSGMSSYKWYKNNVLIGSATTRTYVAAASGSYKVVATNASGCSGTSAAVVVTVSCP